MGSVLDVLPRDGALFTGRSGAVPLPGGRVLVVTPTEAHVTAAAVEPLDNGVPAPAEGLRIQRPPWMPLGRGAPAPEEDVEQAFRRIWPRRDEPDGYMGQEPYTGALIHVARALRQASARQEQAVALAFRLSTGEPSDPRAAYPLVKAIEGLADAARMFRLPVVAGELSTSSGEPRLEVAAYTTSAGRRSSSSEAEVPVLPAEGDEIYLLGRTSGDLSGSLYAGEHAAFPPPIDLVVESRVQEIATAIGHAAPLGRGGLLVTLARCCARAGTGARISGAAEAGWLFGEAQSRMVFFLPRERSHRLFELAAQLDIPIERLGTLGGGALIVEGAINVHVRELTSWTN